MKKILIFLISFSAITSFAQQNLNNLKFDDTKYLYSRTPGSAAQGLKFDVNIHIASVEVISSDNNKVKRFKSNGNNNRFGQGKKLDLIVIPLLYEVEKSANSTIFKFGKNAAEGGLNSAEVSISQMGKPVSSANNSNGRNSILAKLGRNEFYSYPKDASRDGKNYLWVKPPSGETCTIEIAHESKRGKVIVCIFDNGGNLLGALDPKHSSGTVQSYTTDKAVYVIPVITKVAQNDLGTVVFEVGDPKQVATVDVEEE